MVAVPAATAVTTPLATVATSSLSDAHVISLLILAFAGVYVTDNVADFPSTNSRADSLKLMLSTSTSSTVPPDSRFTPQTTKRLLEPAGVKVMSVAALMSESAISKKWLSLVKSPSRVNGELFDTPSRAAGSIDSGEAVAPVMSIAPVVPFQRATCRLILVVPAGTLRTQMPLAFPVPNFRASCSVPSITTLAAEALVLPSVVSSILLSCSLAKSTANENTLIAANIKKRDNFFMILRF